MYISETKGINNFQNVKINIADKHLKVLFILFKNYFESKRNLVLVIIANQIRAFHNRMNVAELSSKV